jgi:hypothetical protein
MAKKSARSKTFDSVKFAETIFRLLSEMEEPLREASHLVRIISLVDSKHDGDQASITFVATKAETHLSAASATLRSLYAVCRK